jgi:hypothetical protein
MGASISTKTRKKAINAFFFSGSQEVRKGEVCRWILNRTYAFKVSTKCRVSVGGTPFVWISPGEVFIIDQEKDYIFDRDVEVLLAYPQEEVDTIEVQNNIYNEVYVNGNPPSGGGGGSTPPPSTKPKPKTGVIDADYYGKLKVPSGWGGSGRIEWAMTVSAKKECCWRSAGSLNEYCLNYEKGITAQYQIKGSNIGTKVLTKKTVKAGESDAVSGSFSVGTIKGGESYTLDFIGPWDQCDAPHSRNSNCKTCEGFYDLNYKLIVS